MNLPILLVFTCCINFLITNKNTFIYAGADHIHKKLMANYIKESTKNDIENSLANNSEAPPTNLNDDNSSGKVEKRDTAEEEENNDNYYESYYDEDPDGEILKTSKNDKHYKIKVRAL